MSRKNHLSFSSAPGLSGPGKLCICLPRVAMIILMITICSGCGRKEKSGYAISPVSPKNIRLEDAFWRPRLDNYGAVTLPHVFRECTGTGRIENFAIAAGLVKGKQHGIYPFDDSDVYKMIEGISVWLSYNYDPVLDQKLDTLIQTIAAAQEQDGYLYTARRNKPEWLAQRSGAERWSNLAWSHELYNAGHLFLAATAHYESTGKHTLLDVAYRNADLIVREFGPDGIDSPPGHQVIEMGLTELYRISGKKAYLDLAQFFLDRRGQHAYRKSWGTYAQDHLPVLEQMEAVGHAVRAAYMYAGMMDVSAFSGDRRYAEASRRLWENVVRKKLYLTGGLGAVGFGEKFSENYDLPNLSAYQETCASIANILWNEKLFLYTGEGKYLDILERTLYNAFLAGISIGGDRFFYPNPLGSRGYHERHAWFPCACCPTNVCRFMPTVPGLFYATRNHTLFVNLFADNHASINVDNDTIDIVQRSGYPWSGKVSLTINTRQPVDLEVRVRVPGWARNQAVPSDLYRFAEISSDTVVTAINGLNINLPVVDGFIRISRTWQNGDSIGVVFSMRPRKVLSHPSVAQDSGRFALQYGPFVYCLESPDQPERKVMPVSVSVEERASVSYGKDLLNGTCVLRTRGLFNRVESDMVSSEPTRVNAIPYFLWANRGMSEMIVWIPADPTDSEPLNRASFASTAAVSASDGTGLSTVNDSKTGTAGQEGFTWNGSDDVHWIRYDFPDTQEFSAAEVYWNTSTRDPDFAPPAGWRIMALVENEWHKVYNYDQPWDTEPGIFNQVIFETVRTKSLRLEVRARAGCRVGVQEWRVN